MDEEPILRAGFRLDRYELLCPIASGGMAAVWLAQLRGKRGFEAISANGSRTKPSILSSEIARIFSLIGSLCSTGTTGWK